jgi:hypothetical protein
MMNFYPNIVLKNLFRAKALVVTGFLNPRPEGRSNSNSGFMIPFCEGRNKDISHYPLLYI